MLGLGSGFYKLAGEDNSAMIYKRMSELANYADLDIHFDFSTLSGDHGDAVTAATNLATGLSPQDYAIVSNEGAPTLDRTSLSRACVDFPNSGDNDNILDMAASYTTSGKPMTFFIVFQWDAAATTTLVASADDGDEDYFLLTTGGRGKIRMDGGAVTNLITGNTTGSTIAYTPVINTPIVYLIQRVADGSFNVYADNNLLIAYASDPGGRNDDANFTLGAIGGTTSGSIVDFNGKVCEVGLYDADIGDAGVSILLESLCTKWGIDRRK